MWSRRLTSALVKSSTTLLSYLLVPPMPHTRTMPQPAIAFILLLEALLFGVFHMFRLEECD